jgi:hypothetical protein
MVGSRPRRLGYPPPRELIGATAVTLSEIPALIEVPVLRPI